MSTHAHTVVSADEFRNLMSRFPSGVTVVTAFDSKGFPRGLTVSAFCAVSLEPPLILCSINRRSETLDALLATRTFTVNVLDEASERCAKQFASSEPDRFSGVSWRSSERAGPILIDDACAHIDCSVHGFWNAGDHCLVLGLIEHGEIFEPRSPLLYGMRSFRKWNGISTAM